jgi:hypothetical protein
MYLDSTCKSKFFDLLYTSTFLYRNTSVLLTCVLLAGGLSACSPFSDSAPETSNGPTAAVTINPQDPQTALTVPPNSIDRPLKPGEMGTQTLPNGLPALQPLKGVNVDQLFSENVRDSDARFDRLENAVLDLRREFEAVKPAVVRLVAVEADIQQLVEQLEVMLRDDSFAPSSGAPMPVPAVEEAQSEMMEPQDDLMDSGSTQASSAPLALSDTAQPNNPAPSSLNPATTSPTATTAATPPTSANAADEAPATAPAVSTSSASSGDVAKALRIGRHEGFTRVVIDASAQTPYRIDLDSQENILLIEMPQATWIGPKTMSFAPSSLVSSYVVEPLDNGQGSRIIVMLAKPATIAKDQVLQPGSNPDFRILIDLKPL